MIAFSPLYSRATAVGVNMSASARDYPFDTWAALWEETCGSVEAAYSVIAHPVEHGWANVDLEADDIALSIYELVQNVANASAESGRLTELSLLRQIEQPEILAVFQELQFAHEPQKFLLACAIYDFNAPDLSVSQLSKFSDERPITDNSASGLKIVDWPDRLDETGRIRKTAGSIPTDHKGSWLLGTGLVLKTQYLIREEIECPSS